MNRKKKSAIKDENSAKKDMIKSKIELKRNVNMNTVAINAFNTLVDNEWKLQWKAKERECIKGVEWLKEKQVKKIDKNVHKKEDKNQLNLIWIKSWKISNIKIKTS